MSSLSAVFPPPHGILQRASRRHCRLVIPFNGTDPWAFNLSLLASVHRSSILLPTLTRSPGPRQAQQAHLQASPLLTSGTAATSRSHHYSAKAPRPRLFSTTWP